MLIYVDCDIDNFYLIFQDELLTENVYVYVDDGKSIGEREDESFVLGINS